MTSVFSWQNSISLFPASLCTPSPNLPVTPGVSTFAFQPPLMKRIQSPIMKRTSFLGVTSKRENVWEELPHILHEVLVLNVRM